MQGHKKLIPEIKIADAIKNLNGVDPTPTPTGDSKIHVYHVDVHYSDRTPISGIDGWQATVGEDIAQQIISDYETYGTSHLYVLKVSMYDSNEDFYCDKNILLHLVNEGFITATEIDDDIKTFVEIDPNGVTFDVRPYE